jgi:hypothetical protein
MGQALVQHASITQATAHGTIEGAIGANPRNPNWRRRLRKASFKGVPFYVEQQGRSSGRRIVLFEYPKRDKPFAEDMGRQALRYQMTGYLIQAPRSDALYRGMDRDYDIARDRIEQALMAPGPGHLVDPYNPRFYPPSQTSLSLQNINQALAGTAEGGNQSQWLPGYSPTQNLQFFCERYSIVESRERGGYAAIEMSFLEAGLPSPPAHRPRPAQDRGRSDCGRFVVVRLWLC